MYMDSDLNLDFKNDFVLMTDNQGNLTCGGFTINNDLLSFSLDNPNVQVGGKNNVLKDLKWTCQLFKKKIGGPRTYGRSI